MDPAESSVVVSAGVGALTRGRGSGETVWLGVARLRIADCVSVTRPEVTGVTLLRSGAGRRGQSEE
jgi:hypothetical protein